MRYRAVMQWCRVLFFALLVFAGATQARADVFAPSGHVLKVLPLLMDTNSQVAPSPSLFDRDAYQAYLLRHTNYVSGMRFDVEWKAKHAAGLKLTLRLELQGSGTNSVPTRKTLEQIVTQKTFSRWSSLTLTGADYKKFGVLTAWRATLWNGDQLLGQQQSFLWALP